MHYSTERKMEYMYIYDRVMEAIGINYSIGQLIKRTIDEEPFGQCIFHIGLMMDDIHTMMHRFAIDGNEKIANNEIHYQEVEIAMALFLSELEKNH